ncbi:MAG: hypothetical protein H7X99_07490, partial [Saprospiraceae bacterium]|nr:hypothetical protein [Saprospiraceae bacterium]
LNHVSYQDSTRKVYYQQLAEITGRTVLEIEADFEMLLLMPDSLMILENRALDTLRFLHDKLNQTDRHINSEIN